MSIQSIIKETLLSTNIGRNICHNFQTLSNPLFKSVEIETVSICNRKCSYCPNYSIQRPAGYMREDLFYKIIDELAEINFKGRFSPHFYGEPLLDKRIVRFITYTRNTLPNACIKLFTNGDLLTYELFLKLLNAGVDVFRIAQHDEQPSITMTNIFQKIDKKTIDKHVEYIRYFDNDKLLMNRGGLIEVKHDAKMKCCDYVSGITIDYEGNMLLCCQDFMSKYKFGNLKTERIMAVWNKDNYKSLRNKIKCGIWPLDICKICNDL